VNTHIDVNIRRSGSLFLFKPATNRGRTWLLENTDGTWLGDALVVEHRYARDLADGLIAEGYGVA